MFGKIVKKSFICGIALVLLVGCGNVSSTKINFPQNFNKPNLAAVQNKTFIIIYKDQDNNDLYLTRKELARDYLSTYNTFITRNELKDLYDYVKHDSYVLNVPDNTFKEAIVGKELKLNITESIKDGYTLQGINYVGNSQQIKDWQFVDDRLADYAAKQKENS